VGYVIIKETIEKQRRVFYQIVSDELDIHFSTTTWILMKLLIWHAGKAMSEGSKWYYYSRRMQSRETDSGYWKPMGMDEPIISTSSKKIVGLKKHLVFHLSEPPTGAWTNWIMHEYRLPDSGSTSRSGSKKRGHSKKMVRN